MLVTGTKLTKDRMANVLPRSPGAPDMHAACKNNRGIATTRYISTTRCTLVSGNHQIAGRAFFYDLVLAIF